jgi:hypothetical protein
MNPIFNKGKFKVPQFRFDISKKVWYWADIHQIVLGKVHTGPLLYKKDIN